MRFLEKKATKSLADMPVAVQETIEIVDIFRPAKDVLPIVEQAVQLKTKH
jgi:predicted CoA-binding protein